MKHGGSMPVIASLLASAGITQTVRLVVPINVGVTNRTSLVTLQNGPQYILREYRWPYSSPDDLQRLSKEKYLHDLLLKNGVPVPAVLAEYDDKNSSALLMEFKPGTLLGDVVSTLDEDERVQAWRATGAALRGVHSIRLPEERSGVIVGERVEPFDEGSWADFQIHQVLRHAENLHKRESGVQIELSKLENALTQAAPALAASSTVLLHNDPHPWNVLVHNENGPWTCSAWLDWEYAWSGDPDWDLVRMDLFRLKPIGPTPDAFYEGYGSFPQEPNRSIYELSIYLWMAKPVHGRRERRGACADAHLQGRNEISGTH